MTPYLIHLIISSCSLYNIDPNLVMRLIKVESNFNINAIGQHGEVGLMQLNPKSFPNFTKKELINPKMNILLGVEYLSKVKESCKHKVDNQFVICYNKGVAGGNKIKYPKFDSYYKRVNKGE